MFMPITEAKKKDMVILEKVSYIYYPLCFRKNKKNKMQTLINFYNEVNVMMLAYILKLGFRVCRINVEAQKIDDSTFETFKIVLTSF